MKYLKRTISEFIDDDGQTMAAALAYFTLFALPPLLLIIVGVAGIAFGKEAVQQKIGWTVQYLAGSGAADQLGSVLSHAAQNPKGGILAAALGGAALLFGASSAFVQLQTSLNVVWHLRPDPKANGIMSFLIHRLLLFALVLAIGLIVILLLGLDSVLSSSALVVKGWLPSGVAEELLRAAGFVVSFFIIAGVFGAMFKVLPDAEMTWPEVRVGAFTTALLFTIGKFLVGFYLGKSGVASSYGAAGGLVLLVLWLYYSSMIVLLGAEFTRVWVEEHGHFIEARKGTTVQEDEAQRPGMGR